MLGGKTLSLLMFSFIGTAVVVSTVAMVVVSSAVSTHRNYNLASSGQNYSDALTKSILFYEGQRSGKLPPSQRMTWRKDSALQDGSDVGMDLVGGYYDAGDNIKFNFPMGFSMTVLAWSVIEFGQFMGSDLTHALDAIRWGTDYFLKCTAVPGKVAAQVGNPYADHNCWERPEDMDTLRTSYVINQTHPGSELAAEIAATLAASSIAFKEADAQYSSVLLKRAIEVFEFADLYRGSYNDSVGQGVCPFYCDYNGYLDELIWGAAWLHRATNSKYYFDYVLNHSDYAAGYNVFEFSWDGKHAGVNVLVSQIVMNTSNSDPFVTNADNFVCSLFPNSPKGSVTYSPGGLMFRPGMVNLQHTTALTYLALVYGRVLERFNRQVDCGNNVVANSTTLLQLVKGQTDYILGENPMNMSYMVGYGNKFPRRIHHRGSSLPSIDSHPQRIKCKEGSPYFETQNPNPNLLIGAVVGGPSLNEDDYPDFRRTAEQSEPTTGTNAPFVGILAFFKQHASSYLIG